MGGVKTERVFPCSNEEKSAKGAGSSPIYGNEVSYIDRRTRAYFIAMYCTCKMFHITVNKHIISLSSKAKFGNI